jgi:probable addiction module antidote protein
MAKVRTLKWDAAEHLKGDADMAAYLEAALEEADPALVTAALGDIARARGMSDVARAAGLGRESLYKALSAEGNPELATILKVVKALGLRLHVRGLPFKPAMTAEEPPARRRYAVRPPGRTRRRTP